MKKPIIFAAFFAFLAISSVFSQTGFRGQSMSGATGLFSIPSGLIGWEKGNMGLDIGYRTIINNDDGAACIPALTLSLLNFFEVSAALDIQPRADLLQPLDGKNQKNNDLILGFKLMLPFKETSVALGGNVQFINIGNDYYNYCAYQPYIAITYIGTFFNMSADTTLVFGKTFYSDGVNGYGPENNSDIDFGMGFDLILFPDVFENALHMIIDFANFSYSDNAWPNNVTHHSGPAQNRGILNTGFRIDLSVLGPFKNFKLLLDFIFNDLFDDGGRSFTIGGVFGYKIS